VITRLDFPEPKYREDGRKILAEVKAELPCGCEAFAGKLWPELDTRAVASYECSQEGHRDLIAKFRLYLADSNPRDFLGPDLQLDRLLRKAETAHRARQAVERAVGS
jgi:hypothetical protein